MARPYYVIKKLQSYVLTVTYIPYTIKDMQEYFDITYFHLQRVVNYRLFREWYKKTIDPIIERKKKELQLIARSALANVDLKELRNDGTSSKD